MQNPDAKMANNLVQSSADNSCNSPYSSRLPFHATHVPADSFILSDNTPDNTEIQFSKNNLYVSDNHMNNMSSTTPPLFTSNFETLTNVNNNRDNNNESIQSELKEWAIKCKSMY